MRGSVLKALLGDRNSPVLYGYDQSALAVYFNQAPVMRVGGGRRRRCGGGRGGPNLPGIPNMQPNAVHAAADDARRSAERGGRRRPGAARRSRARGGGRGAAPAAGTGASIPVRRRPGGRGAAAAADAAAGAAVRRRRCGGGAARAAVVPDRSERPAAVGAAGRRRVARRPRGGDRLAGRQGARRDVRQPPLLALADAGQLLPRLQRDPELERSRRGGTPGQAGTGQNH